jgi:hypothetical protein
MSVAVAIGRRCWLVKIGREGVRLVVVRLPA